VQTQIIGFDQKRLQIYHSLHREEFDEALAASEQMLLHVDLAGPKSTPFGNRALHALEQMSEQQRNLPKPKHPSRTIRLPKQHDD